ncbi:MAG: histidine--tRNA ligase [Kiritimatiellae bacterium]|nr:histidine--tRNA ligase [Kiritimatiellia bacterium]MDW8459108.1 histidine--tRNA ligase [Verrucomicrobiota bacterium]
MSNEELQPLQGMADIGPPEISRWQELEAEARRVLALYGFEEIRTPILERLDLFVRSLGDSTDVVQKEMYSFTDRGGRRLALRPEGTAGAIRYLASKGQDAADARIYYMGPMFRAERPQAGRRRQFHQLGVEALGPPSPEFDAEIIALHTDLLRSWGISRFTVHVNTRGAPGEQATAGRLFREHLLPRQQELCDDCRRRFDVNVLRILDCKNPLCRAIVEAVPPPTDFLSPESKEYLKRVLQVLEAFSIPVTHNARLVRGLDYYVHTIWEITHPALGAQDAIAGGGRYTLEVAGRSLEGVGFAIGMERALMALDAEKPAVESGRAPLVWLVSLGEAARLENLRLLQTLRRHHVASRMCLDARSVKAQFRAADRAGASLVVIRGDAELAKGVFALKNLSTGEQTEVDLSELMRQLMQLRSSAPKPEAVP